MGGGSGSQTAMIIVWVVLVVAVAAGAGGLYGWRRRTRVGRRNRQLDQRKGR